MKASEGGKARPDGNARPTASAGPEKEKIVHLLFVSDEQRQHLECKRKVMLLSLLERVKDGPVIDDS